MEKPMEQADIFLDNLLIDQKHCLAELSREKESRLVELDDLKKELESYRDQRKRCTETLDKNLTSLTSSKRSIQKMVEENTGEVGLPISNTHRAEALSFFSTAMSFINENVNNDMKMDDDVDAAELSSSIKLSNQNTLNEIVKMKNRVADIRVIKETAHLLKEYCPVNFTGEESQLDTSIFD